MFNCGVLLILPLLVPLLPLLSPLLLPPLLLPLLPSPLLLPLPLLLRPPPQLDVVLGELAFAQGDPNAHRLSVIMRGEASAFLVDAAGNEREVPAQHAHIRALPTSYQSFAAQAIFSPSKFSLPSSSSSPSFF